MNRNDEGALDLSLVDEKLEPYVVIFKLENGGWQISKRFKYSDIFGEPQGYFEMRRVHIGLDKDTNVAIAGFPEVPYIQWRGSDVRIELTGGRTAIMELNDETKEWESQELIFDDEDIPETKRKCHHLLAKDTVSNPTLFINLVYRTTTDLQVVHFRPMQQQQTLEFLLTATT